MNASRCCILILLTMTPAAWAAGKSLRVYLPAEKTVETDTPQLGQIALLLGDDALVQAAQKVPLGRFAAAGQRLTIDRPTVLSCLASAGIDARQVQFNGADSTCLKRNEQTIPAERFVETARLFLETRAAGQKVSFKLLKGAMDLVLTEPAANMELSARLLNAHNGAHRVAVSAMDAGKEIAHQELLFTAQYERKRVVAMEQLETGTELTAENTRVETYMSNLPQEGAIFLPYGMIASRTIDAGRPIEPSWVQPRTAPVMVRKQQQVVIKIDTEMLLVSACGEAMQDGRIGDVIQVRRGSRKTNDERFVMGRVMEDGTIQPVLNFQ